MIDITPLVDFLRSSEKEMVDLEKILTSKKALAPENGGDGEMEKCRVLEDWLKANGFSDIQHFDAPDSRVSSKVRPNLVVTIPGEKDDYVIWVMAHLDVVPTEDCSLWHSDPWTVVEKDGKIFGRGVEDNQQGLVSMVFAALAFIKNGKKPVHTVKLLFAADEEVGSKYGVTYLIHNTSIFSKNDIVLIPDGGDCKGETIEIAEKNLLWLKIHVKGEQTHGSRPDQGKNACLAANDLSLRLNGLESVFSNVDALFEPPYSTFQPTMRLANVSGINIIPGEDVFCMDLRILPCYSLDEVLAAVEECCAQTEEKFGVEVCYEIPQKSESPATNEKSLVVEKLKGAIKKAHGIEARTIGIGGGTVGAELRRAGMDCAVWSTLDERAHTPNEYCIVKNIVTDAETLVWLFADND
ncbi:MAG: M20 family metallo-hydrolase [Treponemataceae bacterium]|nr:M20 family metallo-hydrolase [Treponemataceae bacterium]